MHPPTQPSQVGLSAFGFLFSEFIQYSQTRVNTGDELAKKCAATASCGEGGRGRRV